MNNVTEVMAINSSYVDTTNSSTLGKLYIGGYENFNITIQLSGSHGLAYNIYTNPTKDNDNMLMSQTGGSFTSGVHSANTHQFLNNTMNWLTIKASATAVNSASMINVILTSIIHGNR